MNATTTPAFIAPLMLDLDSTELSNEEREILQHPMVGGVVLFARNYQSIEQVTHLVSEVREVAAAAKKTILVAVDHEGGRVQRLRDEFTLLPAVASLGQLYESDKDQALQASKHHGWLMAAEVRSVGIDFSFAPVLDLNYDISDVIGDRAFHADAVIVSELASAYIKGMCRAGMAATGKHFPGHGAIKADSHLAIPVDNRSKEAIFSADVQPFIALFNQGLDAVMPAHVIYPEVDDNPAGFSRVWLQEILRQQLQFDGVIFSDDLTMEGASVAGGFTERAEAALEAGCDMILACNHRQGAVEIIDNVKHISSTGSAHRLQRMKGSSYLDHSELQLSELWKQAVKDVSMLA